MDKDLDYGMMPVVNPPWTREGTNWRLARKVSCDRKRSFMDFVIDSERMPVVFGAFGCGGNHPKEVS
jgi:hypothetical protein